MSRADTGNVANFDGYLTTVVARECYDRLKRRESRREDFTPEDPRRLLVALAPEERPEDQAVLSDSVGVALLILLDLLAPGERVAFVLHDIFDVPFGDIAATIGKTPDAARQLASRARRRVRGASPPADRKMQRHDELVRAFFAASRSGNFPALLALLDPNATLHADEHVVTIGAQPLTQGANAVANVFIEQWKGAKAAFPARIGDEPVAVWLHKEHPIVLFRFIADGDRITGIDLIGDRATLDRAVVET